MSHASRSIASRGLGHLQGDEVRTRDVAPLEPVRYYKPFGVLLADGIDKLRHYAIISLGVDVAWFIQKIETKVPIWNSLVAFGENGPVKGANIQGLGIGPKRLGLRRLGNCIARRTVEVDADMNLVATSPFDGLVDFRKGVFIEATPI